MFVREVAPAWAREVLKPVIEVLAGIPSVVLGFFGMTLIAPLVREVLGAPTGLTAFTGGLLLAYMALPTMISVAEDALDAVPKGYRDAGLAMGATQWQTIWRVVVPAARSGIVTAVMLGALLIHDVVPSPSFISEQPVLAYGIFIAFFVANFIMLALQSVTLRLFDRLVIWGYILVPGFLGRKAKQQYE